MIKPNCDRTRQPDQRHGHEWEGTAPHLAYRQDRSEQACGQERLKQNSAQLQGAKNRCGEQCKKEGIEQNRVASPQVGTRKTTQATGCTTRAIGASRLLHIMSPDSLCDLDPARQGRACNPRTERWRR